MSTSGTSRDRPHMRLVVWACKLDTVFIVVTYKTALQYLFWSFFKEIIHHVWSPEITVACIRLLCSSALILDSLGLGGTCGCGCGLSSGSAGGGSSLGGAGSDSGNVYSAPASLCRKSAMSKL
ncbi:unnamed protein product [Echinostoma caproni]|uniref:Secreted protein n=1 Tax=Echinostoma caproni TaxID=27848 RepID=A0A183A641_9TREM|nr:unnamed protein product [Echinostoma caproni]